MGLNRKQRADAAQKHIEEANKKYSQQITNCIKNTTIYMDRFKFNDKFEQNRTSTEFVALDSVSACFKAAGEGAGKVAVLDFASYKNPGGGFLNGSMAQEESLCHSSILYNVLTQFRADYYEKNAKDTNRELYRDRALYVPEIVFYEGEKEAVCDVIVCAAPNKSAAQKYNRVSDHENYESLKSRIKFILNVAMQNHADVLILGAFGCGVFGQDPNEVAGVFKEVLSDSATCFKKVIFAVPEDKMGNSTVFQHHFS